MRPKYDILWKGMIEEVMEDLLLFVEPGIGSELDLERGFVYLDKELVEIYPEPDQPSKTRVVDKLVKSFLRDGSEHWVLLHIEVQAKNNKDFAGRMFNYFIRLFSKYGRSVAAIAVLTGKDGSKMSAAYEDRCLWMRARYEYKTLAITDYPDEVLAASTNPFAVVMMVAKETLLQVKGGEEERDNVLLEQKLRIVRLLKERMEVFGERKTRAILTFLKNYVVFKKPETNRNFMEQADQLLGKSKTMGIFEQLAEIKHQEGVEEGIQIGKQEGKQENLQALERAIRALLDNTEFSSEKIAELVEVPIDLVQKVKNDLSMK
jgi:hypothetical protein